MLARVTLICAVGLVLVLTLGTAPGMALETSGSASDLVSGIVLSVEPHVVPDTGAILTDVAVLGTVPGGSAAVSTFSMQGGEIGDVGMWSERFAELRVGQTVIAEVDYSNGTATAEQTPIVTSGFATLAPSGLVSGTAAASAGYKWEGLHFADASLPVPFYVNGTGLPSGAAASIAAAAQTWENDPGSYMDFTYMGASTRLPSGGRDGVNVIGSGNLGNTDIVAECEYWYIPSTMEVTQFDITYNTAYKPYATDGRATAFDVQGVATHELGHTLSLVDLYTAADASQVMYGITSKGATTQRVLKSGDIAGVRAIYPIPPPVAVSDSATVAEDTLLTVAAPGLLTNDVDLSGYTLTAEVVTAPAHGSLGLSSDGGYTYRPTDNWNGTDSFTYRIFNGVYFSAPAVVTITVTPVNDVPVSADDSASIALDTTLTVRAPGVLSNDTDADGDSLVTSLTVDPQHGSLALAANGAYQYVPAPGFWGTDTFVYRAFDGTAYSAPATVTVTVTESNQAPVTNPDSASAAENTDLSVAVPGVLGNDTDVEGNYLSAILVDSPLHGTLALAPDGSYTYRPAAGWLGTDTFTYCASDGATLSAPATVTITVSKYVAPPPPSAIAISAASVWAKAPASVKRGRAFYVTGGLSPTHASGTSVTLRFERYSRRRWRVVKRASVTVPPGAATFRYRARLSPRGSWRVIVSHSGDGVIDTGSASVTRRLRVK